MSSPEDTALVADLHHIADVMSSGPIKDRVLQAANVLAARSQASPEAPAEGGAVERVSSALRAENARIVADHGSGNCEVGVAYGRLAKAAIRALAAPSVPAGDTERRKAVAKVDLIWLYSRCNDTGNYPGIHRLATEVLALLSRGDAS